jgi:hypothetical protein
MKDTESQIVVDYCRDDTDVTGRRKGLIYLHDGKMGLARQYSD